MIQNPTLYKISSSTGKMLTWCCYCEGAKVITLSGEEGGKQTEHHYEATPKNVGRANETDAIMQAQVECKAHYKDQETNKHYRFSREEAQVLHDNNKIPRKVHNYKDHGHKMTDTLFSMVKYNGSRACVIDGVMYSKIGRPEEIKVDHLRDAVVKLQELGLATFDAEVYAHGLPLQRIRSAWLKPVKTDKEIIKVAKDRLKTLGEDNKVIKTIEDAINSLGYNPNDDAEQLKFYIFDIPVEGVPFRERREKVYDLMYKVVDNGLAHAFCMSDGATTLDMDARLKYRDLIVSKGFEGLVHYDLEDVYEFDKRSYTTQKDKPRYDGEALVVGVEECKNGDGKLVCTASRALEGVKFKCMMKVSRRDGKDYPRDVESMRDLIGNWITFSYEELSSTGTPTKPVGEMVRECNDVGDPLV